MTDDNDIELWERQNNYLWNVLLLVFKQGLAKQTLDRYTGTQDALSVFREVDENYRYQFRVSIQYNARWQELLAREYTPSSGLRSDFISEWFIGLQVVNRHSYNNDHQSYELVRSTIENAFSIDQDMTHAFLTEPDPTNNHTRDIDNLRQHLYKAATKCDNFDIRPK